jgi:SAM-dependent methyltransferase
VSFWPDLARRSESAELMDDPTIVGKELTEALRQLRWINGLLLAFWPTVEGVDTLWREAGKPARLRIVDVGAGSGENNRVLLWWAAIRGVELDIAVVDIHHDTCREAAEYNQTKPRIHVVQGDLFHPPFQRCDIVTASLVLHHFTNDQLPSIFAALLKITRLGVVVNDLHRHALAWLLIRAATRVLSRNRMIRNDAPLSVQRGFRQSDLRQLREQPGLAGLHWGWRPFFRYVVIAPAANQALIHSEGS